MFFPDDYCVRMMLQKAEGSAFTKTFEVWSFWLTPIKTLRPSESALVVELISRFNEKLRRNQISERRFSQTTELSDPNF